MSKKTYLIAIIGIVILGIATRAIRINDSFWLDEAAQAIESARPLNQQLNIIPDFQPPLYHVLVHFWMMVGRTEWWLRLASVIPGLISIVFVILIGSKQFGKEVGLTAGLLLATSQFHAFYSQELRPYSMATMFALIAFYAYQQLADHKKGSLLVFTVACIGGIYSTYVFPFFLISLGIATFLWHKSIFRSVLIAFAITVISFIPWVPTFSRQLQAGMNLAGTSPQWTQIVSPPFLKMVPLVAVKFIFGRIPFDVTFQQLVVYLVGGLAIGIALVRSWRSKESREIIFWLIVPIVLAWIVSLKIPILDPKRVLFCLPPLYLLIARGIGKGVKSAILLVIILSIQTYGLNRYATEVDLGRENWREAVVAVESHQATDKLVIFAFPESFAPWRWYQIKNLDTLAVEPNNLSQITTIGNQKTIYIFDYLADMTDPERQILGGINRLGYQETDFFQYSGVGKIRILKP